MTDAPRVVVLDPILPPDDSIFAHADPEAVAAEPLFRSVEVAKFFAHSKDWLANLRYDHPDAQPLWSEIEPQVRRGQQRFWNLAEIEALVHWVAGIGLLSAPEVRRALLLVKLYAQQWQLIE